MWTHTHKGKRSMIAANGENKNVNNKLQKSQYWQVVRGICILAVIAIHCPQGTDGDLFTWLGIRQLIDFPVALFIFMAGYFVKPGKVDITWIKNRGVSATHTIFNME